MLGCGVIGNTTDFDSVVSGSIPDTSAKFFWPQFNGQNKGLLNPKSRFDSWWPGQICLCSLTVKQRIYIPCATDNWPMWVRLPPEAPIFIFPLVVKWYNSRLITGHYKFDSCREDQFQATFSNVIYDTLVRFQLHASCVDRSMVEQRLKQPSIKSSLFYFVIPDAAKAEVVPSSAATQLSLRREVVEQ